MTLSQVAGALIILAVFAGVFAAIAAFDGWRVASGAFGFTIAVTALLLLAVTLLMGGAA